ncbi:MAG: NnrS family protein [Bdellovibrionaceae bacterium]|nr:NnrS family protein [Pseudobdellovibrionaceae bacterium]
MNTRARKDMEPYRLLFPCGVVAGVLGLMLWFFFQAGQVSFYPRQAHANIMYFGFLWSFVAGFLMTAIPKMTGTSLVHKYEMVTALGLVALQIVVNFLNYVPASVAVYGIQAVFLIVFIVRRFLKKRVLPFEGFLFIPFAFLQALLAVVMFFMSLQSSTPLSLQFLFQFAPSNSPTFSAQISYQFSMDSFYLHAGEAFVLNLVLGLGTRLIPVLSRVPNSLTPDQRSNSNQFMKMIVLAILLNLGFILQTFVNNQLGIALRLLVVSFIAFRYFKIASSVSTKSFVGFGLRCGILFILSSYAILLFQPAQAIAVQHLIYIGGFVLITFMVGTRVMLAHGGQSLDYETDSRRIGAVALLFALASLLRLVAGADVFGAIMKIGIVVFLVASLLWFHKFIKILRDSK